MNGAFLPPGTGDQSAGGVGFSSIVRLSTVRLIGRIYELRGSPPVAFAAKLINYPSYNSIKKPFESWRKEEDMDYNFQEIFN